MYGSQANEEHKESGTKKSSSSRSLYSIFQSYFGVLTFP